MIEDDHLIPISALQHMLYCERQAALIHIERVWVDNPLTLAGSHLHQTVDEGVAENRPAVRVRRSVSLRSSELGLVGKADVVEFHRAEGDEGMHLAGVDGKWLPHPVEYKRGGPKKYRADEVQLCAQAMCLEEVLQVPISEGALYYGKRRRRTVVTLSKDLRRLVRDTVSALRLLLDQGTVPARQRDRRCDKCSLESVCMPRTPGGTSVAEYLESLVLGSTRGG